MRLHKQSAKAFFSSENRPKSQDDQAGLDQSRQSRLACGLLVGVVGRVRMWHVAQEVVQINHDAGIFDHVANERVAEVALGHF